MASEFNHIFLTGAKTMKMKYRKERVFDVLIEQDSDGYYAASVPALPGCHTLAESLDVLTKRIREAKGSHCICVIPMEEPPSFRYIEGRYRTLLNQILRDCEITSDELRKLLRNLFFPFSKV
jgi:hypothetical protein